MKKRFIGLTLLVLSIIVAINAFTLNVNAYISEGKYVSFLAVGYDEEYAITKYADNYQGVWNTAGNNADMNKGCGMFTTDIYVSYSFTTDVNEAVTDIICLANQGCPDTYEYKGITYYAVPGIDEDYEKIAHPDLNYDVGGAYLYLYYTKDPRAGKPIVEIKADTQYEKYQIVYNVVSLTDGSPADMNLGAGGDYVYLMFLRTVRPSKVTFDSNGGTEVSPLENVTALDVFLDEPTKEGCTFAGWYFDKELTEPIYIREVYYDMTLYAKYYFASTINFVSNCDASFDPITNVEYIPEDLPSPTKHDYYFGGWYYDSLFTKKANTGDGLSGDITLYARFVKGQYISSLQFGAAGSQINAINACFKDGYSDICDNSERININANTFSEASLYISGKYTEDYNDCIRDLILIDATSADFSLEKNGHYVNPTNKVDYFPVGGYAYENGEYVYHDLLSLNYDDLQGSFPYVEYDIYLFATKDILAGNPITKLKISSLDPNTLSTTPDQEKSYEMVKFSDGRDGNMNLGNSSYKVYLYMLRYDETRTASVFSNTSVYLIIAGAVVILGSIAFVAIYTKKKKDTKEA